VTRHGNTRRPPLTPDSSGIIAVEFPLRGEWRAVHTPAERVPSHGSDLWAQTYAFDLLRTHPDTGTGGRTGGRTHTGSTLRFHRRSHRRYWTVGVDLDDCPGHGDPVHAAFDGTVVRACDVLVDRPHLHPLVDLLRVVRNGLTFDGRSEPWPMTGNHVVLHHGERPETYALYAHLRHDSLSVAEGDRVTTGQRIAAVGHTGNSTAPHLHFQLMTTPDPRTATPVPCAFASYEVHGPQGWRLVRRGIPGKSELIRVEGGSPTTG
jgi:murein DD-endopeptidase MepM/ murein hydrolase activator NlpD